MTLADQASRDRIRKDLGTTLIIEAAAGTGKTTELVNRVVAVIASGRSTLDRTVAVTFTEKAAGELKLRLRTEIERARQDPAFGNEARRNLLGALPQLEEARIGTIHSFCADLLRERPVEAGVDPMFEVAPEEVADGLFDAAFNGWFEDALTAPGEGVRRMLCRRDQNDREGPRPILRSAAYELLQWRDFDAPWPRESFDRDAEIDLLMAEALKLGELAELSSDDDPLQKALDEIGRAAGEAIRLEPVRGRDHDALEAILLGLLRGPGGRWRWRGWGEDFGPLARDGVAARRDQFRERLERFRDRSGANLAPLLREELWPVVARYEDLKRRAGLLDFLDLLLIARNMVRDNAAVRAELQRRFSHLFIDEFQDTDPLQAEILMLLAADDGSEPDWTRVRPVAGKLFIVGDPKQSIYRFRRADVSLYQSVKRRLLERGAEIAYLTVSFRAVPELQKMVNAVFAPLMAADSPTQPAYAPLDPFRPDLESQPPIVVLPVPAPYGRYGRIVRWQLDESLPDAVAAFVRWLVEESGWTVTERDRPAERTALRPRHICILFRRLNAYGRDVTRPYIRALEARHIAHVLVRGGSFNEREEVEAIRNALGAIERPDDELLVFATLKGPLFAVSDAALLEFREDKDRLGSLHPFRKLPEGLPPNLAEVGNALAVLRDLHRGRNRRPIADTISRLLAQTRAHAGIAIWPTGEQALANIMRLMDHARRYEARSGATSFRGFVDELEARAERVEVSEAPVVEEGTEGVRIMTVHRAKGLEFPLVILADITCNETRGEPQRFIDPERRLCALRLGGCAPRELLERGDEELRRDQEEALRLLYVAATRARDLLVVPAVGDEPQDGWLGKLNPALYPDFKARRAPLDRQPAGCPQFGDDSVRERPGKAPAKTKAVAPGLHRPQLGKHRVVWWDPFKLELDVRETMGLRQHKLLQADESGQVSQRGKEEHRSWSAQHEAAIASGIIPTIKVATATELAAQSATSAIFTGEIEVEELPRQAGRPHGIRFGTLVHATLLRVPFDADRGAITAAAALQARMLGASADEIDAATGAVECALRSPLMIQAASAARDCRREVPLLVRLEDGVTMEGIADLAFVEHANGQRRWVVVDFKTDAELAPRLNEYRAQLSLYIRAITQSTGEPARGVLLWL